MQTLSHFVCLHLQEPLLWITWPRDLTSHFLLLRSVNEVLTNRDLLQRIIRLGVGAGPDSDAAVPLKLGQASDWSSFLLVDPFWKACLCLGSSLHTEYSVVHISKILRYLAGHALPQSQLEFVGKAPSALFDTKCTPTSAAMVRRV